MSGNAIHGKAVELVARIQEWSRSPLLGVSETGAAAMQAQALGFIAEALALIAAQRVSQDD